VFFLVGFSAYADEALVTGYHLKPASAVVKVGGTVKLKLVYCFLTDGTRPVEIKIGEPVEVTPGGDVETKIGDPVEVTPGGGVETKIGEPVEVTPGGNVELTIGDPVEVTPGAKGKTPPYLVCEGDDGYDRYAGELAPLVAPVNVQWKVDGQGGVSGDKKTATYHAPPSKPVPNKATVAATMTYNVGKGKTILLSSITIFDEVKSYSGTFSAHDVSVNTEYTRNLTGKIRWEFDEYYEEGGWREYTGSGTATLKVSRTGCGTAANFADVPVEGRLKVYDDKKYEFLINLVGDKEQTRTCRRPDLDKDLRWEETFSSGGDAVSSGDPCGTSEFYPRYSDVTSLAFKRKGGCSNVVNRFQEGWSFRAVE